jgi:1-acyl-sn-glycerol-3-phosphate acyltransferase
MKSGAHIMVFPGGSREVAKRKGEAYKLIWKERTGFARMAVEHGYRIIPFAAVGAEDCYDILLDSNEVMGSRIVQWLKKSKLGEKLIGDGEQIFPLARGLGPTIIPRPERFYYSFGKPIETKGYKGDSDNPDVLAAVRDGVKASIESQLSALLKVQQKDAGRGLIAGLLGNAPEPQMKVARKAPRRRTIKATTTRAGV